MKRAGGCLYFKVAGRLACALDAAVSTTLRSFFSLRPLRYAKKTMKMSSILE